MRPRLVLVRPIMRGQRPSNGPGIAANRLHWRSNRCTILGVVEGLKKAIDELLTVDVQALTNAEVHDLTVALQRQTSRLAAVRANAVGMWDSRRVWAEDGSKSAGARLARECGLDPDTGKADVRRARKLRLMPVTSAALADGSLSVDYRIC